jgi:hypothetical protein
VTPSVTDMTKAPYNMDIDNMSAYSHGSKNNLNTMMKTLNTIEPEKSDPGSGMNGGQMM